MKSVTIIDYNMGNLTSVVNAFSSIGSTVHIAKSGADLLHADRVVLPGVGAFGEGMNHLKSLGFIDAMQTQILEKKRPFLGICLGMQLLADKGFEFGENAGLGWIPGEVIKLDVPNLRIPQIGWNNLEIPHSHPLLLEIGNQVDFYFVHSFHFVPQNEERVLARCDYGIPFAAAVGKENILGVQFHPEKSQTAGMILLNNFLKI